MDDDFEKVADKSSDGENKEIARLEERVTCLSDKLNEQRFFCVAAIFLIVDLLTFYKMQTWGGPVSILVIELFVLFVFAKRCGIQEFGQLTDMLINSKHNKFNNNYSANVLIYFFSLSLPS